MVENKEPKRSNKQIIIQQDHNNYKSRYYHEKSESVKSTQEFPSFNLDTVTIICYDAYNGIITNSLKTTYDQITNEKKLTYDLTKSLDCSWLQSRTRLHNQLMLLISMLFKTFNLSNPYQVMIDYDLTAMMSNYHDQYNNNDDDDNKIGGVSSLVTLSHVMKIILINNSIDDSRDDSKSMINSEQRSEDVLNLIKDPFKTQLLSQIFTQYPSLQSGLLLCILLKHISSILGISKMSIFLSSMFHNSSHNDSNNNDGATTTSYTLAKFMLKFVSFLSFTPSSDVVYPILLWFISCITLHPLPLPQNQVVLSSSSSSSSSQAGDNKYCTLLLV